MWHKHIEVDWSLLSDPSFVASYAAPGRRLLFGGRLGFRPGNSSSPASVKAGAFSPDHRVFGSYGGLWSLLTLGDRLLRRGGADPTKVAPAARKCLDILRVLADAESLQPAQLVQLAGLDAPLDAAPLAFAGCIVPAMAWIASRWLGEARGSRPAKDCGQLGDLVSQSQPAAAAGALLEQAGCLRGAGERRPADRDAQPPRELGALSPLWERIVSRGASVARWAPRQRCRSPAAGSAR